MLPVLVLQIAALTAIVGHSDEGVFLQTKSMMLKHTDKQVYSYEDKFVSLLQVSYAPVAFSLFYGASFVAMAAFITAMYYSRGFLVIFRVLAYLFSLSTMTIAVKSVFVNQGFNFPKFVTATHFVSCGILCFGIMTYRRLQDGSPITVPTMKQQTRCILPIAFSFSLSVAANNIALVHSNAAFAEMIGSAAPLCVIGIHLVTGKGFDLRLIWGVLLVIAGVCVCASGELMFTWLGFSLIFLATFLRGLKTTLQHTIMEDTQNKIEPIELLAWMSLPCTAIVGIWGLFTEGLQPYARLAGDNALPLVLAIGVTCVNACVLNVANNFVIKDLGAVGCLLASQLKGILLLMGACVMLSEVIQLQQIAGYVFIAGGVYWYNKKDKEYKEGAKKEYADEKVPLMK